MNPATKKYPRPNLPLLRKKFKQRNERQIVETLVSAKTNWLRPPCSLRAEAWGEAITALSTRSIRSPPLAHPPQGGLATKHLLQTPLTGPAWVHVFLFLLFFFLKAARLK